MFRSPSTPKKHVRHSLAMASLGATSKGSKPPKAGAPKAGDHTPPEPKARPKAKPKAAAAGSLQTQQRETAAQAQMLRREILVRQANEAEVKSAVLEAEERQRDVYLHDAAALLIEHQNRQKAEAEEHGKKLEAYRSRMRAEVLKLNGELRALAKGPSSSGGARPSSSSGGASPKKKKTRQETKEASKEGAEEVVAGCHGN